MANSKLHTCSLLFVTFVWITRVLCCKPLHPLLSNRLIHNSLSWVNSLTRMKRPGHAGTWVCKQLCDCSLRRRPSAVPGNPNCTTAREVESSAAESRRSFSRAWNTSHRWLLGQWSPEKVSTCLCLCLYISPALPQGQSANRHLSKEKCVATSCEYETSLQPLPPDAAWLPTAQNVLYSAKDPTGISLCLLRLSGSWRIKNNPQRV